MIHIIIPIIIEDDDISGTPVTDDPAIKICIYKVLVWLKISKGEI